MYEWMNGNKRAIAIIRVSSHRQKGNTSHETQRDETEKYCEDIGLNLIKIFPVIESAKRSDERIQYRAAKDYALKNNIRHLLFYVPDRETRNLTDHEQNEELVRADKIVLHYVKESRVYHAESPDGDFFQRDMFALMNKHFIRTLRTKSMDGSRKKAEDGWFSSNHLPLGYVHSAPRDAQGKVVKGSKVILPDPNVQKVLQVQREFELRGIEQLTLEQVRQHIVDVGSIPANQISKYRINTIQRRLTNQFYGGTFEWQGEECKGKHELIIAPRLFEKVQDTFGTRGLRTKKKGTFSGGWLRCKECGCAIVYDPKKKLIKKTGEYKTYHYYRCSNGRNEHPNFKGKNVRASKIWNGLEKAIGEITISKPFAQQVAEALNETHNRAREAAIRERNKFKE